MTPTENELMLKAKARRRRAEVEGLAEINSPKDNDFESTPNSGITLERLAAGIKAADEAGNTEDVRKLGLAYRQLQQQQSNQEPDRSGVSTIKAGLDNMSEGIADTAEVIGLDKQAEWLRSLIKTNPNYDPATAGFIGKDGQGLDFNYLPRATLETAPQYAGQWAARGAGAATGAAIGSVVPGIGTAKGGAVGALAGPAILGGAQVFGPTVKQRSARNGNPDDPSTSDYLAGLATAAGSGALDAIGVGGTGSFLKNVAKEAATEGAQSLVEQTGSSAGTDTGLEISPKQAAGEAILGGTSAGMVRGAVEGPIKAAKGTKEALGNIRTDKGEYTQADTLAAETLIKAAGGNMDDPESLNDALAILGNVDTDTSGNPNELDSAKSAANAGLRDLRSQVDTGLDNLKQLAKMARNRESPDYLKIDSDSALQAIKTIKKVSGHQKSRTPDIQINELAKAMPQFSQDVNRIGTQLQAMDRISRFTSGGTNDMGGLSKYTRLIDASDDRNKLKMIAAPGLTGGIASAGVLTGLGTVAGGMVANRLARSIDEATNRRSNVKRYVDSVNKYRKAPDLPEPKAPTVLNEIRQKQQAEAALQKLSNRLEKQKNSIDRRVKAEETAKRKAEASDTKAEKVLQKAQQAALAAKAVQAEQDFMRSQITKAALEGTQAIPAHEGWRLWEHWTGAKLKDIAEALSVLEAEPGNVPPGSLERLMVNPRSFGKKDKTTQAIQAAVSDILGTSPSTEPFVSYKDSQTKAPKSPGQLLKKAKEPRTDKGRSTYLSDRGNILADDLNKVIQNDTASLDPLQYRVLLQTARRINDPNKDADTRFAFVEEALSGAFKDPAEYSKWYKAFTPLAAHGNDFAVAKEVME